MTGWLRMVFAALLWSATLLGMGLWPEVAPAFILLAVAGASRGMMDVAARTLLQRTAPHDLLARVFGLLETLDAIGLAIGSLLAPLLVALFGPEAAIAGLAAALSLLIVVFWRRIGSLDDQADVPVVELALLRAVPMFHSLDVAVLEGVARRLEPIDLAAGEVVIREGQEGERYYVVAAGELRVTQDGEQVNQVSRGGGVGETSLIARVPCTATVTAAAPTRVYALDGEDFLDVVTGHPQSARAFDAIVRQRRPNQPAST